MQNQKSNAIPLSTPQKKIEENTLGKDECDKMLAHALKQNQYAQYMMAVLVTSKCPDFTGLLCRYCTPSDSTRLSKAFYNAETGTITLCENRFAKPTTQEGREFLEEQFESKLLHELTHVYDACRYQQPFTDCRAKACTEIRAHRNGECRNSENKAKCVRHLTRGNLRKVCNNAEKTIEEVWKYCYLDFSPQPVALDSIPEGYEDGAEYVNDYS